MKIELELGTFKTSGTRGITLTIDVDIILLIYELDGILKCP